jgi:hypothetical protein
VKLDQEGRLVTLKRGLQACEFCDGISDVRVCGGQRSNGELCPNRMCVLHSYVRPKGLVCPECNTSTPADLDHWISVLCERTWTGDLRMAYEHTVGVLTDEAGKFAIDFVQPPSRSDRTATPLLLLFSGPLPVGAGLFCV